MISREFVYEFSNFDDIYINFDDIPRRPHDILTREMGVKCRQNLRSSKKQPLRLRARTIKISRGGVFCKYGGL